MYTILGFQRFDGVVSFIIFPHISSLSLSNIVLISLHYLRNKEVKEGPLQCETCVAPCGGELGEEAARWERQHHQRQAEKILIKNTLLCLSFSVFIHYLLLVETLDSLYKAKIHYS